MRNILGFFLLLIVHCSFAQNCAQIVPITVLNYSNQSIALPSERLHASIDGHPVVISRAGKITGERILFLVDVSGSMSQVKFLQGLLDSLLEQIPPGSSLAYGFFSDRVNLSDGFTSNPEDIRKALIQFHSVEIKGHTALFDALDQGLKLFQQPKPGDSIFLISDGGENRSVVQEKVVKTHLRESGIRLFAIVPFRRHIISAEIAGPGFLVDLAEKSGGKALTVEADQPPSSVVQSVRTFWLQAVGSGYLLTIQLPSNLQKPTRWKVNLDASGDKHLKGLSIAFPEKLMPCSSAASSMH